MPIASIAAGCSGASKLIVTCSGRQVVDLTRLQLLDNAVEAGIIRQITVVENKALVVGMRILVDMRQLWELYSKVRRSMT